MFEEVPRERRGVAGLLPVRRVVLGPFVLGGGMLLAALGGSVAVAAAAATMITASAIGSDDAPARPGHAVASASSTQHTVSARRSPARHAVAASTVAARPTAEHRTGPTVASIASHPAAVPRSPGVAPGPVRTVTAAGPPVHAAAPSAVPSSLPVTSAAAPPAPSSSAPLGNAVIHVSGYDQASERLAYQFASVRPGAAIDGTDLYQVIDSDTFTAALAPSATITSGGNLCPPAGSTCTPDQLIAAADSGFFAVVAIDARGEIRSLVEVGDELPAPKLVPAPSTSAPAGSSHRVRPARTSPAPSPSPSGTP